MTDDEQRPALAGEINIEAARGGWTFTIDGHPFPWEIANLDFTISPNRVPSITIEIPARHVTVTHAIGSGA